MAKNEIKIDTTEAIRKMKELQDIADKLNKSMKAIKEVAQEATESARLFAEACSKIKIDS